MHLLQCILKMFTWFIIPLMGVGVRTTPLHLDGTYQFSYAVASHENLNYHGHQETRDIYGITSGSYYHLGPDGLWHHTFYFDDGTGIKKIYTKLPLDFPPPEITGIRRHNSNAAQPNQRFHSSSPRTINTLLSAHTKTSPPGAAKSIPSSNDLSNHLSLSLKKSPPVFPQVINPHQSINFLGSPKPLLLHSNSKKGFTAHTSGNHNLFMRTPLLRSQQNQNTQLTQIISPVTSLRNRLIPQRTSLPQIISNDRIESSFFDHRTQLISQLPAQERSPLEIINNAHRTFSKPISNANVGTSRRLFFSQNPGLSTFPGTVNPKRAFPVQDGLQFPGASFNPAVTSFGSARFSEAPPGPITQHQIPLLLSKAAGNAFPALIQLPLINSLTFEGTRNLPTVHSDR